MSVADVESLRAAPFSCTAQARILLALAASDPDDELSVLRLADVDTNYKMMTSTDWQTFP